jgi:hypothetical protein
MDVTLIHAMAQASLSSRRPVFDPWSVHVGFMVDKVALEHVIPRELRFPPVNFIPPCSITRKNEKKKRIFITGLHNKPEGCGASVASAAGPFTTHTRARKNKLLELCCLYCSADSGTYY